MARTPYTTLIRRVTPPWLQRTRGGRLMQVLAAQADELVDKTIDGVLARMPGSQATTDPTALAMVGRERRIRRGPGEDAATYARRLRSWWDAHRTRGGAYALLGQLYAFFLDWLNVRMDVVYYSGTRRWIDEDGVITRDAITWTASGPEEGDAFAFASNITAGDDFIYLGGLQDSFPLHGPYDVRVWDGTNPTGEVVEVERQDESGNLLLTGTVAGHYAAGSGRVARANIRWAHVWVFFYCPDTIPGADRVLITDAEDTLITDDGDVLIADQTIALADGLSPAEEEIFTAIPREWSAAHIPYITVVLLWGTARLWNYPQPVPTWAEWAASGATWGGPNPAIMTTETA